MKRYSILSMFLLLGMLLASASSCFAQPIMDSTDPDVDGKAWMQSTNSDKRAFLLGVSNGVILEYHLRQKRNEEPSRFVKGWVAAFKETRWVDMVSRVDAYYSNNPEKLNRNVLDVVWHELIRPNWKN